MRWQEFETFRQISRTGSPLLIADVQEYPKWQKFEGQEWVHGYIGLPLTVKGNVIGFLNLSFEEVLEVDPVEVQPLMAFANLAAQAIENARLYHQAKELAIHDELTGIYNRRGLNMLAEREFERAARYQRPLSVLFSDIDDFKSFNDRYSYALGDQVLKAVAGCLKANLREIDVLARFGGDEFVVILPETQQNEAKGIAKRLGHAICALKVSNNGGEVTVSLSFGIAQLAQNDRTCEDLIERASSALRQAKQTGQPIVVA